jgi:predicted RNA-binding Zn-ribbon protein involved in translation (DUF1610 family)
MSKIPCKCGHIIVDQTDSLPYKAGYMRDEEIESYYKRFDAVEDFLNAIKKGERDLWIYHYFGERYSTDLKDSSIIHDILWREESTMYQCDNCGRVIIQHYNSNKFYSFYPDDEDSKGIFKGVFL